MTLKESSNPAGVTGSEGTTVAAPGMNERVNRTTFGVVLGVIVLVGAVIRAVYIERLAPSQHIFPDSFWYFAQARNLRAGHGYIDIARQLGVFNGHPDIAGERATAYWPPLFPIALAGWQSIFGESIRTSQLMGVAMGAATIVLAGLLGRAVVNRTVGLVAAALVAVSPFIIAVDGSLMSRRSTCHWCCSRSCSRSEHGTIRSGGLGRCSAVPSGWRHSHAVMRCSWSWS